MAYRKGYSDVQVYCDLDANIATMLEHRIMKELENSSLTAVYIFKEKTNTELDEKQKKTIQKYSMIIIMSYHKTLNKKELIYLLQKLKIG